MNSWRRRLLQQLPRLGVGVRGLPAGVLVHRMPGPRVQAVSEDLAVVSRRRLERFEREKQLVRHLLHQHVVTILRLYRVNCVIDVGANHGQYARRLRRAGYKGHIVSFEPVAETFERLAASAARDPRWSVHRCALGREESVVTMNVVPGTLSSVLTPTQFGYDRYRQLHDATAEDVPVRRLDALLDEILAPVPDPRPYLKLDTQGYDLEVFAGLGDRARDLHGLQSEVAVMQIYDGMPMMPEAIATYEAAGFEITALYPVSRQSRTGRVVEFDCVMVRADAL
ncbi:MAG TPA: FkbM family methyltransferase [Solirubrobacteraceae bacterium]|nr:FkbM family methyltransferase [Solirubrobacteraceae bacterium]